MRVHVALEEVEMAAPKVLLDAGWCPGIILDCLLAWFLEV